MECVDILEDCACVSFREESVMDAHMGGGVKRPDLSTFAPAIEMILLFFLFFLKCILFTIVDLSSEKSKPRQTSKLKRGMISLITVNGLWIHD